METLSKTADPTVAYDAALGAAGAAPLDGYDALLWDEGRHLAAGLVAGWARSTQWSDFLKRYEILKVEEEIETPLTPDLALYSRIDLLVRDRLDGAIYVVNWKTSSSQKDWNTSWDFDIQGWTECMAAEQLLGEKVAGTIYVCLYKGVRRNGMYTSPLIYGYRKVEKSGSLTYRDSYRGGGEKFPVWLAKDLPCGEGLASWVAWLPQATIDAQFIVSPPILRNTSAVDGWLDGVVRWEGDAKHIASGADHLDFFTQNFSKWNCTRCAFKDVCRGQTTVADLLRAGQLVPRDSPVTRRDTLLETTS